MIADTVEIRRPVLPSEYLALYNTKSTIEHIRVSLKKYFATVYKRPRTGDGRITDAELDSLAHDYLVSDRDPRRDVESFFNSLNGYSPKSVAANLSLIKGFLGRNGVRFDEYFWKDLKRKRKGGRSSRAATQDEAPTVEQLRAVVTHLPINTRAQALALASSGMRIGESLKLTLADIHLDETPVRVEIRAEITKTGEARTTFLSTEAVQVLEEWLKVKDQYLKTAAGRSHLHEKKPQDERVFPWSAPVFYRAWENALRKAGFAMRDNNTKMRIHVHHPHTLRKFFRTRGGQSQVPVDAVEVMMGHEGYLTGAYRKLRDDKKALAKLYLQMEPFVSTAGDIAQAMEVREETRELHLQLKEVEAKNSGLEDRLKGMEASLTDARTLFFKMLGEMIGAKLPKQPEAEIKAFLSSNKRTLAEQVASAGKG